MKKGRVCFSVLLICSLLAAGCGKTTGTEAAESRVTEKSSAELSAAENVSDVETAVEAYADAVQISLSDEEILVNGEAASGKEEAAVYIANDIIFYLEGQDLTYGEGKEHEEHSQEEADAHTVVHITQPGTYVLSGALSAGQIFVDLGEDAKKDSDAVVTLVLNNADVTCTVAPALLFYRVYECGSDEVEKASEQVDLTKAGANVVIADDSENQFTGSHVAKNYESCELSEDGTEVVNSKKLHKYDGAFYSRMSMNLYGDTTGVLNITADNEGLDSELHMTIYGGNINIRSGNDGINTNEDEVSVFTMNSGKLNIVVEGQDGEGDGIDSNGWLVVNGGAIYAQACSDSQDSGIDSEKGIYLNGGTVAASGNMLDAIAGGDLTYRVFSGREKMSGKAVYTVKDADGENVLEIEQENDFQILLVASAELKAEEAYTLWKGESQVAEGNANGMPGGPGGMQGGPGGMPGEKPRGMEPPEGMNPGERPEGMEPPEKQ